MGISVISALTIQMRPDGDIRVQAGGPCKDTGKWVMWIMLYNGDEYDHPILNTEPIFDDEEAALKYGHELVKQIREAGRERVAANGG